MRCADREADGLDGTLSLMGPRTAGPSRRAAPPAPTTGPPPASRRASAAPIGDRGGAARVHVLDVTDRHGLAGAVRSCDRPDVLAAIAGIMRSGPAPGTRPAAPDRTSTSRTCCRPPGGGPQDSRRRRHGLRLGRHRRRRAAPLRRGQGGRGAAAQDAGRRDGPARLPGHQGHAGVDPRPGDRPPRPRAPGAHRGRDDPDDTAGPGRRAGRRRPGGAAPGLDASAFTTGRTLRPNEGVAMSW